MRILGGDYNATRNMLIDALSPITTMLTEKFGRMLDLEVIFIPRVMDHWGFRESLPRLPHQDTSISVEVSSQLCAHLGAYLKDEIPKR